MGQVRYDGKSTDSKILTISPCLKGIEPADLNGDCTVDLADLILFANHWLSRSCNILRDCANADLNHDAIIDLKDWAIFAELMIKCIGSLFFGEKKGCRNDALNGFKGQDAYQKEYMFPAVPFDTRSPMVFPRIVIALLPVQWQGII